MSDIKPVEIAILAAGIILFLSSLGLLFYLVKAGRSYTGVIPLFVLSMIMIGFPCIRSFEIMKIKVELKDDIDFAKSHSDDANATNRLALSVNKLESLIKPDHATAETAEQIASVLID